MDKQINLTLASFPAIPPALAVPTVSVRIEDLCHHMYIDQHGVHPSLPNPLFDYHSGLLVDADSYLRYVDGALGNDTEAKRFYSWLVGRAFCRWFLSKHFGYHHFTHISTILGKTIPAAQTAVIVQRCAAGDTPDYVCSDGITQVCLGEAKGSQDTSLNVAQHAITWRQQFARIAVLDSHQNMCCLKGYISAAQLVSSACPGDFPRLWVEDPSTPGNAELSAEDRGGLARIAAVGHYALVSQLIGLPELANGLLGTPVEVPAPLRVPRWRCRAPQLANKQFVGGRWPRLGYQYPYFFEYWPEHDARVLLLSLGRARRVARIARGAASTGQDFYAVESPVELPEGLSMHSDGTVYGPSGMFEYDGMEDLASQ